MGSYPESLKEWFVTIFESVATVIVLGFLGIFAVTVVALLGLGCWRLARWMIRPRRQTWAERVLSEAQTRTEMERQHYVWRLEDCCLPLREQVLLTMRKMMDERRPARAGVMWDMKRESLVLTYVPERGFAIEAFALKEARRLDRAGKRFQAGVEMMQNAYGGIAVRVSVGERLPEREAVRVELGGEPEAAAMTATRIIEECSSGQANKRVMIARLDYATWRTPIG